MVVVHLRFFNPTPMHGNVKSAPPLLRFSPRSLLYERALPFPTRPRWPFDDKMMKSGFLMSKRMEQMRVASAVDNESRGKLPY